MTYALQNALMDKNETMVLPFWPTIKDGEFRTESMVARSIGDPKVRILTQLVIGALSVEPPTQIFKKSLVAMEILIKLVLGQCHWVGVREAQQQQEQEEEEEKADEYGAGGSAKTYRGMSWMDWQAHQGEWMDQ
nr:hypothetical protein [Tanacetum cinerariifolium]